MLRKSSAWRKHWGGGLETEIMPSMQELASGRVRAPQIRPIELEELARRDPVSLRIRPDPEY